jgi:hypothetical protein
MFYTSGSNLLQLILYAVAKFEPSSRYHLFNITPSLVISGYFPHTITRTGQIPSACLIFRLQALSIECVLLFGF